ncbi:MAG: bifunctional oligoribonuclease/PAP phosphatase NrnA [Balneolaceae bacterium]|nr:MAG: bifunctional oligoribonuclease/PAP phosphatase NrnA [Balneolaceae bacterium]
MFSEFLEKIKKYQKIGVISHIRPDGDCLGAQVALSRWLKKKGIDAAAYNDDEVPENLQWLLDFFPVEKPTARHFDTCDLFICLDGNSLARFGLFEEWIEGKKIPVWMIDHHPNPQDHFELSISVEDASSTCELVYKLISEDNPAFLDAETAKALYTGIITDTGSLQFESVSPETVEIVAELMRLGKFTPNEIIEVIYSNKSIGQLNLLSRALQSIRLFENNQIAVMSVTKEMLELTNTTPPDTEGFVTYPLSITGVKAAVLMKDFYDDGVRISLRSRSSIDVNIWARELQGGGHKKAAGAWHKGPLELAIKDLIQIGAKQLGKSDTTSS